MACRRQLYFETFSISLAALGVICRSREAPFGSSLAHLGALLISKTMKMRFFKGSWRFCKNGCFVSKVCFKWLPWASMGSPRGGVKLYLAAPGIRNGALVEAKRTFLLKTSFSPARERSSDPAGAHRILKGAPEEVQGRFRCRPGEP